MDTESKSSKIHPITAAAGIAVILASLTGIAAMTGLLPNFSKSPEPLAAVTDTAIKTDSPTSQPAATPVPADSEKITLANRPAIKKPTVVAGNSAPEVQGPVAPMPAPVAPPPCPDCGVVESVRAIQQQAPASGLGAAAGALLGGVLGHQVGGGKGNTLATIAGAVGGGFAGNAVEKNVHKTTSYEVIVRMEDGRHQRFIMNEQRWRSGDLVRVEQGSLSARGQ